MRKTLIATALCLLGAPLAAPFIAPPALAQDSVWAGIFTPEQVARGQTEYEIHCAMCHGWDLMATDGEATDLTGTHFNFFWADETIGARHAYIMATKPAGQPGSFEDQAVYDMIAYILDFNGYPTGETELAPGVFDDVVITREP